MIIKESINIKLQKQDACPDCGGELSENGTCPTCEPETDLKEETESEGTEEGSEL